MAEERFEERTEPATPRRRSEARERGHVARSVELNSAVILLAAVIALNLFGRDLVQGLGATLVNVFGSLDEFDVTRESVMPLFAGLGYAIAMALLPFVTVVVVFALAVNIVQVGFLFSATPLVPDLGRLNPISGLQRIFSMRGFIRLAMGIGKVIIVGGILFWTIWGEREELIAVIDREFVEIVNTMVEASFLLSMRAALAILALAILEYAYQRWQYEKDIRMSKQEIKEEYKRLEGDPKIRERRRGIQRQLAMQRMMRQVPKATVVITNPTEIAVALKYDAGMAAPLVVAKGQGAVAERIRTVAAEHRIPIIERPPLARALFRFAEIGQYIPDNLYQAVAEVIAYVYKLEGRTVTA